MIYNGYNFKTGDEVLFKFKGSSFIKGIFYEYSSDRFYISHSDPRFKGSEAPDQYGYPYSWCFLFRNGIINEVSDRDLFVIPYDASLVPFNIKLHSKLIEFLYQKNKDLLFLFYLKLDPISRYLEINDGDAGSVQLISTKVFSGKTSKVCVDVKLGRLVRILVNNYNKIVEKSITLKKLEINDATIEKLHNEWKSYTSVISFQIKKGQDIIDIAYNSNCYHREGHLKSCMTNCQTDLYLYRDNPEQINVVVFYKDNQVCGRTLIWKCTDGLWYHDRLYSSFDFVRPSMLAILSENNYGCLHLSQTKNIAKLNTIEYGRYPYLDSMQWFDKPNKLISNKPF